MRRLAFIFYILIFYSSPSIAANKDNELSANNYEIFKNAVYLLDKYDGAASFLDSAHRELEFVINNNKNYAPAYREMARYFIMKGHISNGRFQPGSLESADNFLQKAININPDYAEAFVLQGHLYRLMMRHKDGLSALEKAEKLGTNDPWLHSNWADILMNQGKLEEAILRYKKAINSKIKNEKIANHAYYSIATCYKYLKNLEKAEEIYKKQIEINPDAAWSYGNYAYFLLCEKDDYEEAIIRYRQARRIMDYGSARYWLAAALYRKWAEGVINGHPEEKYFIEAKGLHLEPHEIPTTSCESLKKVSTALIRAQIGVNPVFRKKQPEE